MLPSVREEGEGAFDGIEVASPPRREPFHVLEKAEDIAGGFAPSGLRGNPLGMAAGEAPASHRERHSPCRPSGPRFRDRRPPAWPASA